MFLTRLKTVVIKYVCVLPNSYKCVSIIVFVIFGLCCFNIIFHMDKNKMEWKQQIY